MTKLKEKYTIKINDEILLIKESVTETFYLINILNRDSSEFKDMIMFSNILNSDYNILKQYE